VAADGTTFLLDLGIFAVSSLLLGLVFARLKLPVVSAQILAGMIVGPYVLGWVKDTATINDLSTIGIVLLLFVIGLELDPLDLRRLAGKVLLVTTVEVSASFALAFAASSILGTTLMQSTIFALAASITSTAIVGKVFLEKNALGRSESRLMIGIMIAEDMFAVVALIVISSLISNRSLLAFDSIQQILTTVLGGVSLIAAAYVVATYVAPRVIDYLSSYEEEYNELPFLFALGLGFLFAVLAAVFGYSPGTGAFVIGLSIRGKRSKFLQSRIATIKDLFIVLFFVSMGSLIDPVPALALGIPLLVVLTLVIVGKFAGGFAASRVFLRAGNKSSYLFGSWLVPRGEFSLIIGQLALTLGIIGNDFFSLIGLAVLVTAVVGPILQRLAEPKMAAAEFPSRAKSDP
jgi:CPA2 family monovalent cation:H+ antiporter-2